MVSETPPPIKSGCTGDSDQIISDHPPPHHNSNSFVSGSAGRAGALSGEVWILELERRTRMVRMGSRVRANRRRKLVLRPDNVNGPLQSRLYQGVGILP